MSNCPTSVPVSKSMTSGSDRFQSASFNSGGPSLGVQDVSGYEDFDIEDTLCPWDTSGDLGLDGYADSPLVEVRIHDDGEGNPEDDRAEARDQSERPKYLTDPVDPLDVVEELAEADALQLIRTQTQQHVPCHTSDYTLRAVWLRELHLNCRDWQADLLDKAHATLLTSKSAMELAAGEHYVLPPLAVEGTARLFPLYGEEDSEDGNEHEDSTSTDIVAEEAGEAILGPPRLNNFSRQPPPPLPEIALPPVPNGVGHVRRRHRGHGDATALNAMIETETETRSNRANMFVWDPGLQSLRLFKEILGCRETVSDTDLIYSHEPGDFPDAGRKVLQSISDSHLRYGIDSNKELAHKQFKANVQEAFRGRSKPHRGKGKLMKGSTKPVLESLKAFSATFQIPDMHKTKSSEEALGSARRRKQHNRYKGLTEVLTITSTQEAQSRRPTYVSSEASSSSHSTQSYGSETSTRRSLHTDRANASQEEATLAGNSPYATCSGLGQADQHRQKKPVKDTMTSFFSPSYTQFAQRFAQQARKQPSQPVDDITAKKGSRTKRPSWVPEIDYTSAGPKNSGKLSIAFKTPHDGHRHPFEGDESSAVDHKRKPKLNSGNRLAKQNSRRQDNPPKAGGALAVESFVNGPLYNEVSRINLCTFERAAIATYGPAVLEMAAKDMKAAGYLDRAAGQSHTAASANSDDAAVFACRRPQKSRQGARASSGEDTVALPTIPPPGSDAHGSILNSAAKEPRPGGSRNSSRKGFKHGTVVAGGRAIVEEAEDLTDRLVSKWFSGQEEGRAKKPAQHQEEKQSKRRDRHTIDEVKTAALASHRAAARAANRTVRSPARRMPIWIATDPYTALPTRPARKGKRHNPDGTATGQLRKHVDEHGQ